MVNVLLFTGGGLFHVSGSNKPALWARAAPPNWTARATKLLLRKPEKNLCSNERGCAVFGAAPRIDYCLSQCAAYLIGLQYLTFSNESHYQMS